MTPWRIIATLQSADSCELGWSQECARRSQLRRRFAFIEHYLMAPARSWHAVSHPRPLKPAINQQIRRFSEGNAVLVVDPEVPLTSSQNGIHRDSELICRHQPGLTADFHEQEGICGGWSWRVITVERVTGRRLRGRTDPPVGANYGVGNEHLRNRIAMCLSSMPRALITESVPRRAVQHFSCPDCPCSPDGKGSDCFCPRVPNELPRGTRMTPYTATRASTRFRAMLPHVRAMTVGSGSDRQGASAKCYSRPMNM